MPFQSGVYRVQEAKETPAIRRSVIGTRFLVGAAVVVTCRSHRNGGGNPSVPFRSIEKDRSNLFLLHSSKTIRESVRIYVKDGATPPLRYNFRVDSYDWRDWRILIHVLRFASGTHTNRPSIDLTEPPIRSRISFMHGRLNPISTGNASGDGLPLIISLMLSACLRLGMVCLLYGSNRRIIRSGIIRVRLSFSISVSLKRRRFFSLLQKDCSEMPKDSAI